MPKIYAHRGASAELPENSLPAFARAIERGAYGIELDVHLSRDGVPVIIHDETVDRTTRGTGAVADMDLAELALLDAGNGLRIPTLDDVLNVIGDVVHVDIEVKAAVAADAVLEATSRRPALRFAVSSFNHDVLRHVRVKEADVELWPLTVGVTDEALGAAAELGSPCLAIHEGFINDDIVKYLHTRGLEAWVWTVNDPDRAAELTRLGVSGICTDDPERLLRAGLA